MTKETKAAFDNILNTFSGEDGGVKFLYLIIAVENFDKKAEKGDEAAKNIILTLIRFSRMIDACQQKETPK